MSEPDDFNPNAIAQQMQEVLPGWVVWHSMADDAYCAVPAPDGTGLVEATRRPGRVSAHYAEDLLALCREHYSWYDICDTCRAPARDCGHRRPL